MEFRNVPFGEFELVESAAPDGYEEDGSSWVVNVDYIDGDAQNNVIKVSLDAYATENNGALIRLVEEENPAAPAMEEGLEVEGEPDMSEGQAIEDIIPTGSETETEIFTVSNKALNSLTIEKVVVVDTSAYDDSVGNAKAPREISFSASDFEFDVKNEAGTTVRSGVGLTGLVKDAEASTETVTIWRGSATVEGLPSGTYTVEESKCITVQNSDYAWEVSYQNNGAELDDGATDTIGVTNTYTHVPNCFNVTTMKVWEDDHDRDGLRPDSLTVGLFIGDAAQPIQTAVLDGTNEWKYVFKYDCVENEGERTVRELAYTIGEETVVLNEGENVPGYALKDGTPAVEAKGVSAEIVTLTNEHVPEIWDIAVRKVWGENTAGREADEVTLRLKANGKRLADRTVKLSEEKHWFHIYEDLFRYEEGELIEYVITEDDLGSRWSYEVEVEDRADFESAVTEIKYTDEEALAIAMEEMKADYGEEWDGLSEEERQRIVSEAATELADVSVIDSAVFENVDQFVKVTNNYRPGGYTPPTVITPNPEPEPEPVVIDEEEVPLAALPDEEVPLAILPEEEVPLAVLPATGDASTLWMVLSALSGTGLFLTRKKHDEE